VNVTPLALHSPRALRDTLRAHGWDDGQAAAAAGGIHPFAFHLTGLDQDTLEALVRLSGSLGLEVLTGDGWAVLAGSRSRLSALARPWLVPPALSQLAIDVGLAMPADPPPVWETARGPIALDRPVILATGIAVELASVLAKLLAQALFTQVLQINSGLDAQLSELCCRHFAHSEEFLDGQALKEGRCFFQGDDSQSIGLVGIGGDLGQKLAVRDARGGGESRLVPDLLLDFPCDQGSFLQIANRVGHVEVRFIQTERFDEGSLLAEDCHDLTRDGPVHLKARGQEDCLWTEALCCPAGHGRMHAVSASLVGGGGQYAAPVRGATHDDRLAAIFRVVPLLDAGVEGIQVEVQDRSCSFVHVPPGLSAISILVLFHCSSIEESFSL